MKIALAQLNYTIGDFEKNQNKIIDNIEKAKTIGADIIVFSELSVCGYPPLDFLENKDFIERTSQSIQEIALICKGITAIVGAPKINNNNKGKKLYNSAFVLSEGKILQSVNKTLLPTYDIFDEYRYFEPNKEFNTIQLNNETFALTICEDLWDNQPVENSFDKTRLYTKSPLKELDNQFNFIINIAASPFSVSQDQTRKQVLIENAKEYQAPTIYVNQAAANTELIFDGQSMVINSKGEVVNQMKQFEEDFLLIDTQELESKKRKKNKIAKQNSCIKL